MKKLLLIILLLNFNLSFSQEIELIYDKKYQGAIFPKTYKLTYPNNFPNNNRFTPTKTEIQELESRLRIYFKKKSKPKTNRGKVNGNGPTIQRHLNKYARQYIGFIDDKGQRVIHVNFIWNEYSFWKKLLGLKKPSDSWKSDWQFFLDGGSYYWNINYIISKNEFNNLNINGVA